MCGRLHSVVDDPLGNAFSIKQYTLGKVHWTHLQDELGLKSDARLQGNESCRGCTKRRDLEVNKRSVSKQPTHPARLIPSACVARFK